MGEIHPWESELLTCIELESGEQESRYRSGSQESWKQMKADGVMIHPIQVTRKTFGFADYPEIYFRLPFGGEFAMFRDNSPIECFIEGEEAVRGVMLVLDGSGGSFRLFAPDFPDWIEERGVGIRLTPDIYTNELMTRAIQTIGSIPRLQKLFELIHGEVPFGKIHAPSNSLHFKNNALNKSQQKAVEAIQSNDDLLILHGPPGTGKTTTLVEGIFQLTTMGKRLLVCAPSNAAVDHIGKGLLKAGIEFLRVGNGVKTDEALFAQTPEGKIQALRESKDIKRLKIQAEEYRKMAMQYKRHFGREEREQRNLLLKEVKAIRKQIRDMKEYLEEKLLNQAAVILGTPVGVHNFLPADAHFDMVIIDEAGQALEPLAWLVFPFGTSWILAGDPLQLPPTVLSASAAEKGFNVSILERAYINCEAVAFLDTQYRMRAAIASFPGKKFYDLLLQTPAHLQDTEQHLFFYDTAGTGYEETSGADGNSLMNEGEMELIQKLFERENLAYEESALISPYAGQVQLAKERMPSTMRCSTIDSFQGQEKKNIVLSLVRSNPDGIIGFLKDYRRMNVAMTRAQERLFIIGDSATIGQDSFYQELLGHLEETGAYRSAWELLY